MTPGATDDGRDDLLDRIERSPDAVGPDAVADRLEAGRITSETAIEALCALAEQSPERADAVYGRFDALLDAPGLTARAAAADAIGELAERYPDRSAARVGALADGLDGEFLSRTARLRALGRIAATRPGAVAPVVADLAPLLAHEFPQVRQATIDIVAEVAGDDPTAVEPLVPALVDVLTGASGEISVTPDPGDLPVDRENVRFPDAADVQGQQPDHASVRTTAAIVLAEVAPDVPEGPADAVPRLRDALVEGSPQAQLAILDVLVAVARERPDEAIEAGEAVASVLKDREADPLRERSVETLGHLVDNHPVAIADATSDAVPELVDLLRGNDADSRAAAAGLLSYVAQHRPDAVDGERARAPLVDALEDDRAVVRGNAVLALAAIGDEKAIEALRAVEREDPDANVRDLAADALDGRR